LRQLAAFNQFPSFASSNNKLRKAHFSQGVFTMIQTSIRVLIDQIEQVARKTDFSGVISIHQADAPLYEQAFGYRDIQNQLPNSPATRFGIASGTKFFTALGIGRLIDQGLLTLETEVGKLSPEYVGFINPRATIQHLLTHTSGIYDYYDEEIEQDFDHFFVSIPWYQLETPSDYWPLFQGQAAKFQPGERFSYSNGGYVFLGLLIEKITGRLFRDFMQEQVFQVAHMPQTGFYALNNLPANTALGYLEDRQTTNIYNLPIRGGGDGGLLTTAEDLRSFWQHLFSQRLLSPELTAAFLRTHYRFSGKTGYGCGLYKQLDESQFAIVGGDAGVGFDSRYLVKPEIAISILSNITHGEEELRQVVLDFFDQTA
jgi:CubicO group peptidase (beta-lactamase class C family)